MRRKSVLACASVAAGLLLGPVPAAHAAVTPVLYGVGSGDHPGAGLVSVSASSDTAVTSITAHLYAPGSAADAQEVAEVSDFTLVSGTGHPGLWQTTTPLRLADLGTYRVVVDLTDADGDTTTAEGTYAYQLEADLTDLQATPRAPDHEHQDVTVSGGFTITDPRTGGTTPAAGAEVDLEISGADSRTTTTGADGRFTAAYKVTDSAYTSVNAWLRLNEPWYQSRANQSIEVRAVRSDTRVTLDATELDVKAGQSAQISGTAEVNVGGAWKPLSGATVDEVWSSDLGGAAARPVTGTDGRFTGQLTLSGSGSVEVNVRGTTFLDTSPTQKVKVYVARKTSVSDFTAKLDKNSKLTAKGLLHTGTSMPADEYNKVELQYSADGKTGWTTVKTVTPTDYDPDFGASFKGAFAAPSKGYYRAHFKGGRTWQESYSPVVYAKRTPTRVLDGNASPEPVRKGRTITCKGKLQHYTSGAWKAYADQKVKILFRAKGASTWQDMGNATTRSDGTFSKGSKASKDGTWVAVLLHPDGDHLVSAGREDFVDVR
ncbi:hypothetical protein HLK59_23415 [Streptomyces sp. S3(2020)]|uniref:hypothetical protein n=1 Tax=Streptomyces sp. S3(2020) TaxID=2732044 RepID=UPI0014897505|nr:hypothetical protein [Streptomyces sp. S3(2020)]NNN33253.1 hypothetical protein [Streptomyces sp. S3(2020)]